MTPSHASRGEVRYRYYNSVDEGDGPHPRPIRIAARDLELRAIVHADRIEAKISRVGLGRRLGIANPDSDGVPIELDIPTLMVRRGTDVKLTIQFDASASSARRDPKLVELLVKAHQAKRQLGLDGRAPTVDPHLDPYARKHLARLARFAFLAPEITISIMEGSQPAGLSARKLIRCSDLPTDWKQQKHMLGVS